MGANQGGHEVVESGAGADLVVGMRRGHADFSIRKKLASETFAQNKKLDGIPEGNFAEIQGNVFLSPRHIKLGLDGIERDFFRQFLKAFLVQFDAVHVEADEKFVELFGGSAFHDVKKLENGKMCFLRAEEPLGEFGATGKAVGKIESFGNHDAGIAVGPVGGGGALEGDADAELEGGKIAACGAVVVGSADDENFAREDAGLGNCARVSKIGFGFKNGEDDGVAFDKNFFRVEAVEKFLYRLVQIQAEVRGGAQAAGEKILGHFFGPAAIGFDDEKRNDHILLRIRCSLGAALVDGVI